MFKFLVRERKNAEKMLLLKASSAPHKIGEGIRTDMSTIIEVEVVVTVIGGVLGTLGAGMVIMVVEVAVLEIQSIQEIDVSYAPTLPTLPESATCLDKRV